MSKSDPYEKGLAAGEAAASAAGDTAPTPKNGGRMYVRTQGFGSSDDELRFLQRCGVKHKAANFPFHPDSGWKLDELVQVGLFNILEERDVQIRGFPIRLSKR